MEMWGFFSLFHSSIGLLSAYSEQNMNVHYNNINTQILRHDHYHNVV